jgi:DNA-binding MarR family transcriptional regulator
MLTNMHTRVATLELASELRVALMRLTRRLRAERPAEGITLTQISALGVLERHGAMNLAELSAHERVQPPSMTRTTAALVERGLASRTSDPADKRHVVFELTDGGRALLREDRRRREMWLAGQLAELTAEERALLHSVAPLLNRLAQS